jgi:uncharacterized protein YjdB
MTNQIRKPYKLGILLIAVILFMAYFGMSSMGQAQAAAKYITKVEGTYTSSLSLLQLKVTIDTANVGDVKAVIDGKTYDNFKWSSTYYQRGIAGVKLGSTIKVDAYGFDNKVIETRTFSLDKTGKLVETAPVKTVPVTSVSVNLVLKAGSTASFEAMVSPTNATNNLVIWTSSDNKVATVDSKGNVKAIKAGKATITATTKDGAKKASLGITVK